MYSNPSVMVIKSNSAGELLNPEMTVLPEEPKLKRTFTLRPRRGEEANKEERCVFRRPSIRRFIHKIAQHLGNGLEAPRVPPVGLQTWGPDDTPGVTGLKNHGNTCFINAVLQCISHTDVLAEYFVLDRYKVDLSKRNKLNSKKFGTKGEVTEQLALMLKALWACQYSPELSVTFKQVVERHGSQYKGNQQHDALEFLQWLLDKVHEDLNTASKKKYKSIKTSGRPDEVIAAETLENYKRCNNSFIQSIFQAQYRSSLSCSRCRTQSNTFDPFQCISVQLPQFSKHSVYVTVLYTSQQPRQVQIGVNLPSGASISELRDILESDTSIERANMLITEIGETGFLRTFTDQQFINIISEIDPIYCIEVAQLKDVEEDSTSAYILLCWINVLLTDDKCIKRFGSPYTMQVSRETNYDDLQKLILKEMACILHDDVLTSSQTRNIFKMRISDPACNDNEDPCYLEPELEHPLFMEAIDQALALCSEEGGPPHLKLVLEWNVNTKTTIIADDSDLIDEHSSVKQLRAQALQGGAPLTLEECLRDYTEAETLTDAWRCPHCQQYQPVIKTLDVWSLPDILIVHFKRFRQQSLRGCNSSKLLTMVDFPVENFDMTPHLANNRLNQQNLTNHHHHHHNHYYNDEHQLNWSPWKKSRKPSQTNDNIYDLYAICYHHGNDLETGHYTAACKNPYDNNWYLYDDAKVKNLSMDNDDDINNVLVNNSAYILFYQKRNGNYVGLSNSNSSAASTSSVGSGGNNDHWVMRMAKFQPPKNLKIEKKIDNNKLEIKNAATITNTTTTTNKIMPETITSIEQQIELRNSQNALNNVNQQLHNCVNSITTNLNENNISPKSLRIKPNEMNDNTNDGKKKLYTTSIYINSCGHVDIETNNCEKSPVSSIHRLNSQISHEDISLSISNHNVDNKNYTTNTTLHRYSDSYSKGMLKRTQINWMSPQPERKLHQSQQSM